MENLNYLVLTSDRPSRVGDKIHAGKCKNANPASLGHDAAQLHGFPGLWPTTIYELSHPRRWGGCKPKDQLKSYVQYGGSTIAIYLHEDSITGDTTRTWPHLFGFGFLIRNPSLHVHAQC